jgi:hypothetical protein
MTEQIINLAAGIANPSEGELPLLEMLCRAAEREWMNELKGGVLPDDCGEAFLCAAAFTAVADFALSRNGENVASFTAGAISVRQKASAEETAQAEALRKTANRLMAPYGTAMDFAFKGVLG